jgi:hypothetical protein
MAITLGCDPELILRRDDRISPAHDHFKAKSPFGTDGCSNVAEIRPGFSESPVDLTSKIYQILEYGAGKVSEELEFLAGHFQLGYPIGGHIHFGLSPQSKYVRNLDITLESFSSCVDDKAQKRRRRSHGYGELSATRRKGWGFEYRTPGSFLISPAVTLVTLTLAKLSVLAGEEGIDLVSVRGGRSAPAFLKTIRDLSLYIPDDCQEGLDELELILNRPRPDWSVDIKPNWGL